jgi:hypothetical protein
MLITTKKKTKNKMNTLIKIMNAKIQVAILVNDASIIYSLFSFYISIPY